MSPRYAAAVRQNGSEASLGARMGDEGIRAGGKNREFDSRAACLGHVGMFAAKESALLEMMSLGVEKGNLAIHEGDHAEQIIRVEGDPGLLELSDEHLASLVPRTCGSHSQTWRSVSGATSLLRGGSVHGTRRARDVPARQRILAGSAASFCCSRINLLMAAIFVSVI